MAEKVVITDCDLPGSAGEEILEAAGLVVERHQCRTEQDVIDASNGAAALIVQWAPISSQVLQALDSVRIVSRFGIGYDMVDVDAATKHGIAVANTPAYCTEEVALHTLAMVLGLTRGIKSYDNAVRNGQWAATKANPAAARPGATTIAVIGYGRIGSLVAQHCAALGFQVIVHDPLFAANHAGAEPVEMVSLDEALRRADVVSLHAPLTADTHHMIDAAALATMRNSASLVNTCRGPLVDEAALLEALQSGQIAAAALDVFEAEPLDADHRLLQAPNLTVTPHAAWYSPEAMIDLPIAAATNVVDFLRGAPVPSILNADYARVARPTL